MRDVQLLLVDVLSLIPFLAGCHFTHIPGTEGGTLA